MKFFLGWFIFLLHLSPSLALSETVRELQNARAFWLEDVVRYCEGYPSKQSCDDGDSVLFNGLLCASGEVLACEAVKQSQGADGRWWRSPRRVEDNLGEENSFSRDQALGVLLYLATSRDEQAAKKWLDWIDANSTCAIENPLADNCSVKFEYRYCDDDTDGRCLLTDSSWSLMGRVWKSLGLDRHGMMRRFASADASDLQELLASSVEPGYRMHLKAVSSFLKLRLGSGESSARDIAREISRRQPENLFFQFVEGQDAGSIATRLLDICPSSDDDLSFRRYQWSWERDTASQAWQESMGWDCVFLANLLIQELENRSPPAHPITSEVRVMGAASDTENRVRLFLAGQAQTLSHKFWEPNQWLPAWEDLGGSLRSAPAATSDQRNRVRVAYRGTDNALWMAWWQPGHPWQHERLGGQLDSGPAATSDLEERVRFFYRGPDRSLQMSWWQPGRAWTFESLGGILTSEPAAVSDRDNRVRVFYRGTDNALWMAWWQLGSPWKHERLGGQLTSSPSAISPQRDHVEVYYRGTDLALWLAEWSPQSGWKHHRIGTQMNSAPTAASDKEGRSRVFFIGEEGGIHHIFREADGRGFRNMAQPEFISVKPQ